MLFCLIIALLSTFLWLNITIADTVNKVRENEKAAAVTKVKTVLAVIMAVFWGIVIRYGALL